ncbi:MAG TPA: outer membrane protein assembly factor BamE [Paracoccaceae bacterium]|nr:outer membrane protein assembly factor BamE [Paracoccaceae bacterium]
MAGGAGSGKARRAGLAATVGLAVALAACAPIVRNHGYAPTEEDLALLSVGVDTRETVAQSVGRPSAAGLLNDTGWFYVQSRFEQRGPREAREVDRQVVAITFDDRGTVTNIERFGLAEGRVVPLSRRVTETNVRGMSFIRSLFQSFGRISAGQLLD